MSRLLLAVLAALAVAVAAGAGLAAAVLIARHGGTQ